VPLRSLSLIHASLTAHAGRDVRGVLGIKSIGRVGIDVVFADNPSFNELRRGPGRKFAIAQ
jgi:hypothetical protein